MRGFGHFQAECPMFLKRQNRSYVLTLSDDETYSSESEPDVKALVSNISTNSSSREVSKHDVYAEKESGDSIPVLDDPSYQALFIKWCQDLKVLDV